MDGKVACLHTNTKCANKNTKYISISGFLEECVSPHEKFVRPICLFLHCSGRRTIRYHL